MISFLMTLRAVTQMHNFFSTPLFLLFFVQLLCTRSQITNLSLRAIAHVFHVAVVEPLRLRHDVTTYSRLVKAARILHAVFTDIVIARRSLTTRERDGDVRMCEVGTPMLYRIRNYRSTQKSFKIMLRTSGTRKKIVKFETPNFKVNFHYHNDRNYL